MSEMIERVARAMFPEKFDKAEFYRMSDAQTQAGDFEYRQKRAMELVRVGIEAMREPTESMTQAPTFNDMFGPVEAKDCWQNMIDDALGTKP